MAQPSNVLLRQGNQYQATITLRGFQVMASNRQVEDEFKSFGFSNVSCSGNGVCRIVKGTWSRNDQEIALPDQVSNVREPVKSLV